MRVLVLGADVGPELPRALSESHGGQGGRPRRAGTREPSWFLTVLQGPSWPETGPNRRQ